jgi:hypothetical protein
MLFGVLPDSWQRAIYSPSQTMVMPSAGDQPPHQQQEPTQQHQVHQSGQQQQSAAAAGGASAAQRLAKQPGQAQHGQAGLILDLLYIVLLFVLSVLLALALILAQHLRRKELEEEDELVAVCCHQDELAGGGNGAGSLRRAGSDGAPNSAGYLAGAVPVTARGGRLLSAARRATTSNELGGDSGGAALAWSCTCNNDRLLLGADERAMSMAAAQNGIGPATTTMDAATANNNEDGQLDDKDEFRFTQAGDADAALLAGQNGRQQRLASHAADAAQMQQHQHKGAPHLKWRGSHSATPPNRWARRRPTDGGAHQMSRLALLVCGGARTPPLDDNDEPGQSRLGANAHRLSSKSLANLASNVDHDHYLDSANDGEMMAAAHHERKESCAGLAKAAASGALHGTSPVGAGLVHKGVYYAGGGRALATPTNETADDELEVSKLDGHELGARLSAGAIEDAPIAAHDYGDACDRRPSAAARQRKYDLDDQQQQQLQTYRMIKVPECRCCWPDLAPPRGLHSNKAPPAKAEHGGGRRGGQPPFFDEQLHYRQHAGRASSSSAFGAGTMPGKLNLSSVYAIRSAAGSHHPNPASGSRALEPAAAARKQRQSKSSSGSGKLPDGVPVRL